MKRIFLILFFYIISSFIYCFSQNILTPDTCIDMKFYKSYCIIKHDTIIPLYCFYSTKPFNYSSKYKYSRKGLDFYGNTKHFKYACTGYDKGHLVPAEDMSYSNIALESTFRWWNCVPQKAKFNRGIWKQKEILIHNIIKNKKLNIIVGACNYKAGIPKYCYKAVFDREWNLIMMFIYDQNGNNIDITDNFKKQIYKIVKQLK